ncbi:hypothetical protein Thena_0864 [Thermodesulfobium narugense DSM 14796]|uniref:Uncharacterized protein n=1 Tax=Thermodesulfobium narugense DSM 14796 TaxID=747365 RepID=M1E8I1_9BACT|nr:hypothetical protein [Thermodesulfobium narugense]AEE14494.1 hypothetical protein Thena_0864 [Thermodesulfobium narugense DSM 14796]
MKKILKVITFILPFIFLFSISYAEQSEMLIPHPDTKNISSNWLPIKDSLNKNLSSTSDGFYYPVFYYYYPETITVDKENRTVTVWILEAPSNNVISLNCANTSGWFSKSCFVDHMEALYKFDYLRATYQRISPNYYYDANNNLTRKSSDEASKVEDIKDGSVQQKEYYFFKQFLK